MATGPYYSQRQGRPILRDQENLGERVWMAFTSYIRELAGKDYFAEQCPQGCPDGNGVCSWLPSLLEGRIYGELPNGEWPLPTEIPEKDTAFDYVEFFYRIVSKPTGGSYHDFFRHVDYDPGDFDGESARAEYSERITQYLQNCRHPYDFVDGRVQSSVSPILDAPIHEEEFVLDDQYLQGLLESATTDFFDKSGKKKQVALQTLVDAYERLKTIEDPDDKRDSVEAVLRKVSPIDAVRDTLNIDMKVLTDISNEFTIRHHEMNKRQLDDDAFTEYLFYAYYNVIRLILKKYGNLRLRT